MVVSWAPALFITEVAAVVVVVVDVVVVVAPLLTAGGDVADVGAVTTRLTGLERMV